MVKFDSFKKILQQTQPELKETLEIFLSSHDYNPVIGDGYLYAEGDIPILLVAHLDIVHYKPPAEIYFDEEHLVMWSPTGIGGDDRCGVYTILQLICNNYKPSILFLEDEEKGCIGAKKCVKTLDKPNVKFMIELDRRGIDDCVFYQCDNKEFHTYIESFGFKTAIGSCSDIITLSGAWDIASVNLSIGYYNEHTNYEHIKMWHLKKTFDRVKEILKDDTKEKPYYDYQKKVYKSTYTSKKKDEEKKEEKAGTKKPFEYYYDEEGNQYGRYGWWDTKGNYHWYENLKTGR